MTDIYTYSGWLIFVKKVDPEVFFEKSTLEEKLKLRVEYEKYCQTFESEKTVKE